MQSARLPLSSMDHAIALAAMGHAVSPRAYLSERSGAQTLTWFCDSNQRAAQALLNSLDHADPKKNLVALQPESPFLACLAALRTMRAVQRWLSAGAGAVPVISAVGKGRLCSAVVAVAAGSGSAGRADDLMHTLAARPVAASLPGNPGAIAALIVCGFIPSPVLRHGAGGAVRLAFPAFSDTFSGLSLQEAGEFIRAAGERPEVLSSGIVGEAAPGEHALCYALAALQAESVFRAGLPAVERNPVVMMPGAGTRTALVSADVMRQGARGRHRDLVARHLAGLG